MDHLSGYENDQELEGEMLVRDIEPGAEICKEWDGMTQEWAMGGTEMVGGSLLTLDSKMGRF